MASKARSPFQDIVNVATQLPWQLGGLLALVAYWILHDVAGSMAQSASHAGGHGGEFELASLFQYLVPGLLFVIALISFARRRDDDDLLDLASNPMADAMARMSPHDFEKLVTEAFRREGFLVVARSGTRRLGCVDLELFKGRDRYLVQCRRWQDKTVEADVVRELHAVISAERAVGGFIVTSGRFTDEARKIALGRSIRLVPADSLRRLIKKVIASSSGEVTISPAFSRRLQDKAPPACPKCGKLMMPRTTKQIGTVIQTGWQCTSFPACLGSREL
ncbi:MAG: restriction endonuclease [Proteobacteria bacterium]|nr:restriction endonuclease [Pseudomonadota bacterium]